MIAPDLIKIKPPKENVQFICSETSANIQKPVKEHHFNHCVMKLLTDYYLTAELYPS